MLIACLTIVPIALLHCLWSSDVEIECAGLRIVLILLFKCIGFCSWSVEASGLSLADLLHSFRSFASLLICLSPALDIGGLSCVMVVVSYRCVLHGPYPCGDVMVFVDNCHDLCRSVVDLVSGSCVCVQ